MINEQECLKKELFKYKTMYEIQKKVVLADELKLFKLQTLLKDIKEFLVSEFDISWADSVLNYRSEIECLINKGEKIIG